MTDDIEIITVTDPEHLRRLGWEIIPSYVSAAPKLLLHWLCMHHHPNDAEKMLMMIIAKDYAMRHDPNSIEARVVRQRREYKRLKQMQHLVDTADTRHAAQMAEWQADPEYKAALHAHDNIFDKPGPRST